jgi:hypothetical protein
MITSIIISIFLVQQPEAIASSMSSNRPVAKCTAKYGKVVLPVDCKRFIKKSAKKKK